MGIGCNGCRDSDTFQIVPDGFGYALVCTKCGYSYKIKLYFDKNEEVSRYIRQEDRFKVLKRQKWKCNSCATQLKFNSNSKWNGEIAHIDHIHPYSKRESYPRGKDNINELTNLQALCPKCNKEKYTREN